MARYPLPVKFNMPHWGDSRPDRLGLFTAGKAQPARISTTGQSARGVAVGFSMRMWTSHWQASSSERYLVRMQSARWAPRASRVSKAEESIVCGWVSCDERRKGVVRIAVEDEGVNK